MMSYRDTAHISSRKNRSERDEHYGNIMSNEVETIKNPLTDAKVSPKARGRATFVRTNTQLSHFERFKQVSQICASKAIAVKTLGDEKIHSQMSLDMGICILCGRCRDAAPDLFKMESKFAPPARERSDLIERYDLETTLSLSGKLTSQEALGSELNDRIHKVLGRSLAVREVDAGSCNGCEVEINALNNPIYDIERFGIHFVASPRHADVLLVTGPVSRSMEVALRRTYEAAPDPKIVVAIGACGCSGGIFGESYASVGGVDRVVPVDVYVQGCPPRPQAILQGLLTAVAKIGKSGGTIKHQSQC